jgi:hypothetical protein
MNDLAHATFIAVVLKKRGESEKVALPVQCPVIECAPGVYGISADAVATMPSLVALGRASLRLFRRAWCGGRVDARLFAAGLGGRAI